MFHFHQSDTAAQKHLSSHSLGAFQQMSGYKKKKHLRPSESLQRAFEE